MHKSAAITAIAGLACATGAQQPFTTATFVTYSWTWQESTLNGIPTPNPNGLLDPGESALIRLSISFANQNTTATYAPPSPPPGSGTIRGFSHGFIDVIGTCGAQGTWNTNPVHGLGVALAWDLAGPAGWGHAVNGGATWSALQFGQFPLNASAIITENPITEMWRAVWTPAGYSDRTVAFTAAAFQPQEGPRWSVFFQTSAVGVVPASCPGSFGAPVTIPIIPAPASTFLFLAAPFLTRRRRPHAEPSP